MIKLGQIYKSKDSLQKLFNCDLPVIQSYQLSKVLTAFNEELKRIEEVRTVLVKKHGTEKDGMFTVEDRSKEQFFSEFNPLLETEVDIPITKIKLEILNGAKLSAIDVSNLEFILEE